MNIETRKLSELRHADYNPRKKLTPLDPEYQKIARSIDEFGYVDPIIINSDNTIIGGHQRATVLKDKGWDEVKVVVLDIPKEQEKALNVALNKISGEWDMGMLKDLLLDIDTGSYDVTLTGFDLDEIEDLMLQYHQDDPVEDDDFDAEEAYEEIEEPETQPGDVWYLGNHRMMCGDSTDMETVEQLLDGTVVDLVLTDPPYGIDVVGGSKPFGTVGGKNIVEANTYMSIKGDDTTDTAKDNYEVIRNVSKNQIIFGGNYFTDFLAPSKCWLVWDKENTGNFADVELAWTSFDKGAKLYRWLWNGLCRKGERSVEGKSRVHPTQKPVGLMGEILKDFTSEGETVLDCFGGSGSTLIACEQLDRICYMMELDEKYCDVIVKRYVKLTGDTSCYCITNKGHRVEYADAFGQ